MHRWLRASAALPRWTASIAVALLVLAGAADPAMAQRPVLPESLPPSIVARLKLDSLPNADVALDRLAELSGRAAVAQDEVEPALVEQSLGAVWAAAPSDAHVYLGVGPRIVVLDRSSGRRPEIVSRTDPLSGTVLDLAVQGDFLYVVADFVHLFDISERTEPREISRYEAPTASQVHVSGKRMILMHVQTQACGPGIEVVDIADPREPSRLSRALTCTQGLAIDMTVAGDMIYFVTLGGSLYVNRLDDEGQLHRTGAFYNESIGLAIEVVGDYAYFAFSLLFAHSVFILDVSDPSIPTPMDLYSPSSLVVDLASHGDVLYLALSAGVEVVDVSRPTAPRRKTVVEDESWAAALSVVEDEAFVLGGQGGGYLELDLADPAAPVKRAERAIGGSVQSVAVAEDWLLAGSAQQGVWAEEGHDPARLFDSLTEPGPATHPYSFEDIEIASGHAFLASMGGLAVLPLGAEPGFDSFATAESLILNNDLTIADDRAYLVGSSGLTVFDVSTPMSPTELGRLELPGSGEAVAVQGDVAYVADGEEGVHRIDVSDPTSLTVVGTFESDGAASDVDVGVGHVFVATERAVQVVELDADGAMWELVYLAGPSHQVHVVGERVINLTHDGLRIVNVLDPGAPYVLGERALPGTCTDVQVVGSLAYVACEAAGLFVLDIDEPDLPATPTPAPTEPPARTPTAPPPTVEPTPAPVGGVFLPVLWTGE